MAAAYAGHHNDGEEGCFELCCDAPHHVLGGVETIHASHLGFGHGQGYGRHGAWDARAQRKKNELNREMDAAEVSQHIVDARYKDSTEELLEILRAQEAQAKEELELINANRAALREQICKWKDERDLYEDELVNATRKRMCTASSGCVIS